MLRIPEDTLEINFIRLNKKEGNPWKPPAETLISPSGTPDPSIIIAKETPKTTTPNRRSTLLEHFNSKVKGFRWSIVLYLRKDILMKNNFILIIINKYYI